MSRVGLLIVLILAACSPQESPSPTTGVSSTPPSATATATAAATGSASAAPSASASATPEPPLSLDLPETDPRTVSVTVEPAVGAEGGEIVVTVTSAAEQRIDELVLRWPTELNGTLFLAPFVPTQDRIRDGGQPLVQDWTKWVIGPGEHGEPEGTISLGWGPLLPGATLTIPINVQRVADGPVSFDLQVLARNELLTLDGGAPAELRVEIP